MASDRIHSSFRKAWDAIADKPNYSDLLINCGPLHRHAHKFLICSRAKGLHALCQPEEKMVDRHRRRPKRGIEVSQRPPQTPPQHVINLRPIHENEICGRPGSGDDPVLIAAIVDFIYGVTTSGLGDKLDESGDPNPQYIGPTEDDWSFALNSWLTALKYEVSDMTRVIEKEWAEKLPGMGTYELYQEAVLHVYFSIGSDPRASKMKHILLKDGRVTELTRWLNDLYPGFKVRPQVPNGHNLLVHKDHGEDWQEAFKPLYEKFCARGKRWKSLPPLPTNTRVSVQPTPAQSTDTVASQSNRSPPSVSWGDAVDPKPVVVEEIQAAHRPQLVETSDNLAANRRSEVAVLSEASPAASSRSSLVTVVRDFADQPRPTTGARESQGSGGSDGDSMANIDVNTTSWLRLSGEIRDDRGRR